MILPVATPVPLIKGRQIQEAKKIIAELLVNEATDYGKVKTNEKDFEPGKVHFSILSFKDKSIDETVDLFYKKVQELIEG